MAKKTTLKRRISRRATLGLFGGAAVAAVVGCGDDEPSATQKGAPDAHVERAGITAAFSRQAASARVEDVIASVGRVAISLAPRPNGWKKGAVCGALFRAVLRPQTRCLEHSNHPSIRP